MSEPIQSIAQNNYILQAPPQTATMFTTELEYDGDKISGYAGSAFKAGTDLEFGYDSADNISAINNSALTDVSLNNIVQTNSGSWGGSALPISAGPGIKLEMNNGTLVASTNGYVWQSASLFHTDTPATQTTYTLSDDCSNYDKLEVDFYDINNWHTQMDCPIPPNLASSGTRGGYFNVVTENTSTTSRVWFKCFNWTAAQNNFTCYCSEITAQGGSTTQSVNANQPDNPPKVINIIGWKRVGGN